METDDEKNYEPSADDCRRCRERGKTWSGSNPRCAFKSPSFTFNPDNWNCATAWAMRDLIEKIAQRPETVSWSDEPFYHAWASGSDDQYFGSIDVANVLRANIDSDSRPEGDVLIFSSYKDRGRIMALWIVGSDGPPHRPTLGECETVLQFYKYDELKHQEAEEYEASRPVEEAFLRALATQIWDDIFVPSPLLWVPKPK